MFDHLSPGEHICHLYDVDDERQDIALKFIQQGLAQGDRIVILSSDYSDTILPASAQPVESSSEIVFDDSTIVVLSKKMSEDPNEEFDVDLFTDWLTAAAEIVLQPPDNSKFKGTRVLAQIDSILTSESDLGELESFESLVHQYFITNRAIILCQYHRQKFRPRLLIEALTTHPTIIIGKELIRNFYYISPIQNNQESQLQQRLEQWTNNLLLAHKTEAELYLTHAWIQGASDMVVWLDETGNITYANSTACERLGYSKDELLKLCVQDIQSSYNNETWRQSWLSLVNEKTDTRETELTTKNKQTIPVEVKRNYISFGGREYACAIARDISEQQRREKLQGAVYELSEAASSAKSQQELFETVHRIVNTLIPAQNLFIALYDAENNRVSFPYYIDEYDSPPTPRKNGRGLVEYLIKTERPLYYSPDSNFNLREHGILYIGTYAPSWMGVPLKTTDGRIIGALVVQSYNYNVRYGEDELAILNFVSCQIAMSIERQSAEEDLRFSEENFRMLVEGIQDYAAFMIDDHGIVVSWNSGAERMMGYQAGEIIGKHFSIFYTKEDVDHNLPRFELSLASRKGNLEQEGWRVRKNGSKFFARVTYSALYNDNGAVYGFIKVVRDITQKRSSLERTSEYHLSALDDF
jgi:PAS domain S-box-containing protein